MRNIKIRLNHCKISAKIPAPDARRTPPLCTHLTPQSALVHPLHAPHQAAPPDAKKQRSRRFPRRAHRTRAPHAPTSVPHQAAHPDAKNQRSRRFRRRARRTHALPARTQNARTTGAHTGRAEDQPESLGLSITPRYTRLPVLSTSPHTFRPFPEENHACLLPRSYLPPT